MRIGILLAYIIAKGQLQKVFPWLFITFSISSGSAVNLSTGHLSGLATASLENGKSTSENALLCVEIFSWNWNNGGYIYE